MTYEVKGNEIAFVIKPVEFDEEGNWTGELSTAIAIHPDNKLNKMDLAEMLDLVTLLGAFLEVSQYDDYVYDTVEAERNRLIGLDTVGVSDTYEEVEGTNGKVVRLTIHTKTKGSA
tara:strand:+ start:589 stop:936 length:348 start_codon:yes stop_codon:yes gene_type:complete